MLAELDRSFHSNMAIQVTGVTGTYTFDPLAAQSELFTGLGAFRNVDSRLAREGRNIDLPTQCGRSHADGNRAMQIIAIALKNIVLFETKFNVQVARGPTIGSRFAIAGTADTHATINACRDFYFQCFLFFQLPLPLACNAGLWNDFSAATAGWAGLLHAEEALAHLSGQHDNRELLSASSHIRFVDRFLAEPAVADAFQKKFASLAARAKDLEGFVRDLSSRQRDRDYLAFRYEELNKFQPSQGDWVAMNALCQKAKFAAAFSTGLTKATTLIDVGSSSYVARLSGAAYGYRREKLACCSACKAGHQSSHRDRQA